jgi:5-methylcytosine-specific restriction endonuclease McrA
MLTFPKYRKEMKGIDWGKLYDTYGGNLYDTDKLEKRIADLMMDDDVTNKKGIYEFVLSGEERCLSIRAFTDSQKRRIYEYQKGICKMCHQHFEYEEMQGDHIVPWSKGGKTVDDNLQMLCADCNRKKMNI